MLKIENLHLKYGTIEVLHDICLEVKEKEIVSLLGANGAGKTSLLSAISCLENVYKGNVFFDDEEITNIKPDQIVKKGIIHSPEGRRIFADLTVWENILLGAYTIQDDNIIKSNLEKVLDYFPILADRKEQKAGTLSGGEQQMLALGRAILSSPKLLMLDEPSLGLAPQIIEQIFSIITQLNQKEDISIFLIEQNANEALLHSDRAYVLENGKITISGESKNLLKDENIIKAYLGG